MTGIEDLILLFMEQNYQLNVDQSIFSVYSIFYRVIKHCKDYEHCLT